MRALSVLSLIAGIFAFCSPALAHCRVTDLNLEPAISRQNELRQSANAQVVRDLRTLREAATKGCLCPAVRLASYHFRASSKKIRNGRDGQLNAR